MGMGRGREAGHDGGEGYGVAGLANRAGAAMGVHARVIGVVSGLVPRTVGMAGGHLACRVFGRKMAASP